MVVVRGSVEMVEFVVLLVDSSEVVSGKIGIVVVVAGIELKVSVEYESVGVVANVTAGDMGLDFLRDISKKGYQYCLEITSAPFLKILVFVRLATGQYSSVLLFRRGLSIILRYVEGLGCETAESVTLYVFSHAGPKNAIIMNRSTKGDIILFMSPCVPIISTPDLQVSINVIQSRTYYKKKISGRDEASPPLSFRVI